MQIYNITNKLNPITPLIPLDLNNIKYIVIHHPDAITASPEQINQWHKQNNWNMAGYNEYIRKDGSVYIMRGDNTGAQCHGYNSTSYGICCEGNFNIERTMTEAQFKSLIERLIYHTNRFPNKVEIVKHSQLNSTSCPGIYFPFNKIVEKSNEEFLFQDTIKKFVSKGLISSPDYWTNNCVEGKKVSGKYVNIVILNFVAMFKIVNTFEETIQVLKDMGIINSPDYWLKCKDGFEANGEYVRKLFNNMGVKF